MCVVVNIRKEEYDIYGGRPGNGIQYAPYGNPHAVGEKCKICGVVHKRGEAIPLFEEYFYSEQGIELRELVEKNIKPGMRIGCFCKPKKCHCDIIADYVNNGYKRPVKIKHEEVPTWE